MSCTSSDQSKEVATDAVTGNILHGEKNTPEPFQARGASRAISEQPYLARIAAAASSELVGAAINETTAGLIAPATAGGLATAEADA